MRFIAFACLCAAGSITIAGCSSPGPRASVTAGEAARQHALAAAHALNPARSQAFNVTLTPQVRLGILATPADTAGLAGAASGFYSAHLSSAGVKVAITAYLSPTAQAVALEGGALDVAYTTPAAAITAWRTSHGAITIISGADNLSGQSVIVLAARRAFLVSHPAWATAILQGQVQAAMALISKPATAIRAAAAELRALTRGRRISTRLTALKRFVATDSPVLTGLATPEPASQAAGALLDLTPLNRVLRASGLAPAG
jgi:ABC-type nitrate/sulfonate/bicarbonate transport system substrate-binding protein